MANLPAPITRLGRFILCNQSSKKRNMQQASINFINLLAARAHPQTTHVNPFNTDHWFDGAFRTIQRRIPKGTFSDAQKQDCANLLFTRLPQLQPATFDGDIQKLICELAVKFPLSIGQSQKLVNILLKYYACLYFSQLAPAWNQANSWIPLIHNQQHVPIDSIVLFGLCRLAPVSCNGFLTVSARYAHSKNTDSFVWNTTATIFVPDSLNGKGVSVPWSGLTQYDVYLRLQTIIRGLADTKQISPILYEMRHLWI